MLNIVNAKGQKPNPALIRRAFLFLPPNRTGIYCRIHPFQECAWESNSITFTVTKVQRQSLWQRVLLKFGMEHRFAKTIGGVPLKSTLAMPEDQIHFERNGEVLVAIVNLRKPEQFPPSQEGVVGQGEVNA